MKLTDNMQGALFMSASMAGFALNDASLKFVGADLGIFQSIFLRGIFAVLLIGSFAYFSGAFKTLPPRPDLGRIGLRSLAEIGATLAFLTALYHMPLANITAILQALPLTIALAAAVFFGEPMGRRRIMAIAAGFVGVLIIIRPGADSFNGFALLGLVAVAFVTVRDLSARRLSPNVSSLFVAFIAAFAIMVTGGIGVLVTQNWTPPSPFELGILAMAGCFLFVGYYCSVATMRIGEVAVVSPFRYSIMLWAMMLGWLIFGDIPDSWTIIGMMIIVGSGIFTMWRERQLRRAAQRAKSPAAQPEAPFINQDKPLNRLGIH